MGRPLPGVEAALLRRGPDGRAAVRDGTVEVIDEPGVDGELALRPGWPSMFRGYLHDDERYRRCFADSWYLSGDLVRRDAQGWFWFVGRGDDVIDSSIWVATIVGTPRSSARRTSCFWRIGTSS